MAGAQLLASDPGRLTSPGFTYLRRLPLRVWLGGIVLAMESCAVAAAGHPWFNTHQITAGPVVFLGALLFFGRERLRSAHLDEHAIGLPYVALHVAAVATVFAAHVSLLRSSNAGLVPGTFTLLLWFAALAVMALSLPAALVPPATLLRLAARLGSAWGYAIASVAVILSAKTLELMAWEAPDSWLGQRLVGGAFTGVHALLSLFYTDLVTDPAAKILGTDRFCVRIAGVCSGIEGLALVLVLTGGWMVFERRHLRLSRALWLVPISLALIWALNIVRITALIVLGTAGHADLAVSGFHTEAGLIAFTSVAVVFLVAANKLDWLQRSPTFRDHEQSHAVNTATIYLLPFAAVLATSLLTRALSSGFEWLYGLRLVVAAAFLYGFRKRYLAFDWKFSWLGPVAGLLVGCSWIALSPMDDSTAVADGLHGLTPAARSIWLITRLLAAVLTVPLIEELAFRGFLARRFLSQDVDGVSYRHLPWLGIAFSSLAFGALHGSMWMLGTVAGAVFALVARRCGRLSEAVAAHVVANLAIACWVLVKGDFGLWM